MFIGQPTKTVTKDKRFRLGIFPFFKTFLHWDCRLRLPSPRVANIYNKKHSRTATFSYEMVLFFLPVKASKKSGKREKRIVHLLKYFIIFLHRSDLKWLAALATPSVLTQACAFSSFYFCLKKGVSLYLSLHSFALHRFPSFSIVFWCSLFPLHRSYLKAKLAVSLWYGDGALSSICELVHKNFSLRYWTFGVVKFTQSSPCTNAISICGGVTFCLLHFKAQASLSPKFYKNCDNIKYSGYLNFREWKRAMS